MKTPSEHGTSQGSEGLVLVYTGNGKGKTTAALGLGLRQVGWGRRVLMIQFMKGENIVYGERVAAQKHLPLFEIEQWGRDDFVNLDAPEEVDVELARRGFARAEEAFASGQYDTVILDEVCVAAACGLVDPDRVVDLLRKKAPGMDVVLTGRYCPPQIIDAADTVSEIKEVKHHFQKGIVGRKAMEY